MATRRKLEDRRITLEDLPEGFNCDDVAMALDKLCQAKGFDFSLEFSIAFESAWGGELRITLKPMQHGTSDRSLVFYRAGGQSPEGLAVEMYNDAMDDLFALNVIDETEVEPSLKRELFIAR